MNDQTATLKVPGKEIINLPILKGSMGEKVIEITTLSKHNILTFDHGFSSTASCKSEITYVDGEIGMLLHRGYSIEEIIDIEKQFKHKLQSHYD